MHFPRNVESGTIPRPQPTPLDLGRAVEAVRADHEKLRRQVTGLPLALIEWDGAQRVVGFSDRARELFGFGPEEVLGRRFDEIPWVDDADWAMARAEADAMRTTGRPAAVTAVRNRRKDGSIIHCEWYTSAQHDDDGRLVSMMSLVLDVTDRVRAEDALRASEARARAVLENVRDQIIVLDPVRGARGEIVDWTCLHANAAALELVGRGPELVGMRVGQVLGEDFLRRRGAVLARVLETGEPSRYEAAYRDQTLIVTLFRIDGPRLVSASLDITDRKRREVHQAVLDAIGGDFARLATEEEIGRSIGARLADHLRVQVCSTVDIAGDVATVHALFTSAGQAPPPTQLGVSDHVSQALQAEARAGKTIVIEDVRTDGRVHAARAEALGVRAAVIVPFHRDGEWTSAFEVGTAAPRAWREDEIHLLEAVAARLFPRIERARAEEELRRSNAELRAVRARLEEADRRKDEFLAILSHELRNPLAPIRNSIQLLDHAPDGEVARRAREILGRQTEHLVRIVSDLLDITRITHGKIDLQLARVDARELVRRAYADLVAGAEQRGIALLLSLTGEPVWVEVDEARLAQMIANLLHNALKFTPRGGQVHLGLRRTGAACEVRVRDTGVGIAAGDLERIFQPFVQVERTRRTHGGVGIGLALVRQLAELQGGTVHAESAGADRGAEFVIALPLSPEPADAQARRGVGPGPGAGSVLIVDDNEDAATTLADLLGLLGHEVQTASSGEAGLAAVAARPPDVLLCDVGLPDMSGHDVIRAVRRTAGGAALFAVALTGYAQPRDRELAVEAGFDAHLGKPARLEELEQLLADARRRRARGR